MLNSPSDSNFYGLGTHEWIGIILPYESQKLQQDADAGFGVRRRVAIMGMHPQSTSEISDKEIVFALVALPTTSGTGAGGRKMSVRLTQGDIVLGKFLDGDARQNPIILSCLGRTRGTNYISGRFGSKTGFVGSTKRSNMSPSQKSNNGEFNEDFPESLPKAQNGTPKTGRSNSKVKNLMSKSGLVSGAVGMIPKPIRKVGNIVKKLF